jgi:glucose/arabinose dehydrogenase
MLVLERDTESVVWLADSDNDGLPDVKQTVAAAPGLNHGLAIHDGHLYASSDSTVYRWPIIVDLESAQGNVSYSEFVDINNMDIVVNNINRDGQGGAPMGHRTRTLEFDDSGNLYISVGSDGNVDPDSHRSRIRRVNMYQDNLTFPLDFQELEVFADGLRNTVGLGFDKHGVLWGVENGADNLQRDDLGGDITEDNVSTNNCVMSL